MSCNFKWQIAKGPRAFTLIELLVVISIIALLVSILLPALASAREAAVQITCIAQIRSIGQAMAMYGSEHNQYFPVGYDIRLSSNRYYAERLNRYLGVGPTTSDTQAFAGWFCPATDDARAPGAPHPTVNGQYANNVNLMQVVEATGVGRSGQSNPDVPYPWVNEVNVKVSPAALATFIDGKNPNWWQPRSNSDINSNDGTNRFVFPHFTDQQIDWTVADETAGAGLAGVFFLDGHAGVRKATDFATSGTANSTYLVTSP